MRSRTLIPLFSLVLLAGLAWPFVAGIGLQVERISIRHAVKQRIKAGVPEGERVVFRFTEKELDALDWEPAERHGADSTPVRVGTGPGRTDGRPASLVR